MNEEKKNEKNERKKLPNSQGVKASFTKDEESLKDALMKRKANLDTGILAGMDTARIPITWTDPMMDPVLTLFPKENIRELNRRLRHYYNYHPIVRNIINTHVEFSLADFDLICKDPKIQNEYLEVKENLNLHELLMQAARDYFLLGEAFLYGQWSNELNTWINFLQYPPENIEIYKTYVGEGVIYLLKPDEQLKKTLTGSSAADRAIASLIQEDFKQAVLSGRPYQLSNSCLIHLANRPAAYIPRGTSLVTSVLKYLLLEDKLLNLLFVFVDRNMWPLKIWKIGDKTSKLLPTQKQINEFKVLLAQAASDPDMNIVTHPFIEASFETPVGKLESLEKYFEFIQKRILIGLLASDEFIKGQASPYATNTSVNIKVIMQRYIAFRERIEYIVKRKIFLPIAKAKNYIDKDGKYILPTFKWKIKNILNENTEREFFLKLHEKGQIPFKLLAEICNIDAEWVKEEIVKEQATPLDPLWRDAIKELSKDKEVIKELVKGTKVQDTISKEKVADERITKPGRPEKTKLNEPSGLLDLIKEEPAKPGLESTPSSPPPKKEEVVKKEPEVPTKLKEEGEKITPK